MHLTFHRSIFWAHLISGILAGIVILSIAISGLLIAYEVQLMDWANRDLRVPPPIATATHLDIETLLAKVQETKPDLKPSGITWKADPALPVTLSMGREGTYFANPYTGEFLGEGNHAWHDFFHAATDWHRFLTGTGLPREVGKAITGAGTLVFGILLASGIYLWWPRHWRWTNVRAVLLFNRKLKGRARDWNWHNVLGFWSAIPMLFIILTGLIMSYTWANNLLFRATGNEPPPPRTRPAGGPGAAPSDMAKGSPRGEGGPRGEGRPPMASAPVSLTGLAPLLQQAREQTPGWASLSLRMPQKPGDPFPVMVDRGGRGQVHLRTMLNLDTAQQKLLPSPDDITRQNLGRRLRMYSRYLHTGELFGFLGQTIAALCTLAAALLVWTGFALAWRRFFGRKTKASAT
ncbi:PepSY-associated TM helix domain-containing protein [Prosthecobacter dejongeii]|uniref:Putative iron-regulated membrane protein n=1 Tax=Prosthecobacter dejongeii TaxID=48465 RepID=A0A7W7YNX4_9BACT|nr:PepSY-associated TM helix domain-containing protein [Prosthecobacter dejongeii]MBB5039532.1 putative iron-regulated membrane protein [Prosthecobacter dejongeii]